MKIILVYNPQSGSALSKSELRQKCRAAGIEIEKIIPIHDGFERVLAPFVKSGKNIAVVGGDGTVSAVAGQVAHTKATLIPLPGGTLNHFTKDLGIPQDIDDALGRLHKQKVRRVDVAHVNNTCFINNSSIGIYPATLRDRENIQPALGKWPAAVMASLRALMTFRTYRITLDGRTFATPFVFVGNNRYALDSLGGTRRSALDQGVLTVFVTKTRSRLTLLKIALFALVGRTSQLAEFDEFHPAAVTISTARRHLSVSHDGEVSRLSSPLMYKVEPRALKIIA